MSAEKRRLEGAEEALADAQVLLARVREALG